MNNLFTMIECENSYSDIVNRIVLLKDEILKCDAYNHPYGFNVFKLIANDDFNMRLHIWSKERDPLAKEFEIHDHIYSFKSLILAGGIIHTVYDIVDSRNNYRVFEGSYGPDSSTITPTEKMVTLSDGDVIKINQGERYNIKSGRLHLVEAFSGTVATILATRRDYSRQAPLILGDLSSEEPKTFYRKPLGDDEKVRLMGELFSCI